MITSMSQQEQHSIIGNAVMERAEAKRKASLLNARLREIGRQLVLIGSSLSPLDRPAIADAASESSLRALPDNVRDVLRADKISDLITERNQAEETVQGLTSKLQAFGAE